jgi:hypothetical protein
VPLSVSSASLCGTGDLTSAPAPTLASHAAPGLALLEDPKQIVPHNLSLAILSLFIALILSHLRCCPVGRSAGCAHGSAALFNVAQAPQRHIMTPPHPLHARTIPIFPPI